MDPDEDTLEEVEPVALDLNEIDLTVEGFEGYPEEVDDGAADDLADDVSCEEG